MAMMITTLFLVVPPFIFLLIKLWNKTKSPAGKYKKLPPSPPRLPIIGHLHHLVGGLPHEALDRVAKRFGPVLHLQLGEVSTIVISSRQAAKEVLKSQDPSCADRPESVGTKTLWYNNTDIVFSPYNEYWRQMRKICIVELLSPKNVRSFGSIRQDEMSRLVKSFRSLPSGEAVNLTDKIFTYSSTITCRAAFGEVLRDRDTLIPLMKKASTVASGLELADLFPSFKLLHLLSWNKYKLLSMRGKLDAILSVFLEEHRLKPPSDDEDIIDVLLRMQKNSELEFPITNDNIKGVIFDMFAAGTETSATVIDWVMVELVKNPRVMEKVQTEVRDAFKGKTGNIEESDVHSLKYLQLVIKESLRLHPPVPLLPRACREECKVEGYTIPLGSKVLVSAWSMGRDPEYWPEPESFKPERFESNQVDFLGSNFEFVPFGAGRRFCPGMNFGLATVENSLAQLLYHFDWKMPQGMSPDDIDMTEASGITVSRKNGLFLVPVPVY